MSSSVICLLIGLPSHNKPATPDDGLRRGSLRGATLAKAGGR